MSVVFTTRGMLAHLHLVYIPSDIYISIYLPIDLHCTAYVFDMLSREVSLYRDG